MSRVGVGVGVGVARRGGRREASVDTGHCGGRERVATFRGDCAGAQHRPAPLPRAAASPARRTRTSSNGCCARSPRRAWSQPSPAARRAPRCRARLLRIARVLPPARRGLSRLRMRSGQAPHQRCPLGPERAGCGTRCISARGRAAPAGSFLRRSTRRRCCDDGVAAAVNRARELERPATRPPRRSSPWAVCLKGAPPHHRAAPTGLCDFQAPKFLRARP